MAGVGKFASNVGHSKVKESIDQQKKVVDYSENSDRKRAKRRKEAATKDYAASRTGQTDEAPLHWQCLLRQNVRGRQESSYRLEPKASDPRDRAQASKGKEKDQLISEFESLYGEKSAIESKYITEEESSRVE